MHVFHPLIAAEYGIAEAVIINHFQFWIKYNKRSARNEHDGRTWTYQSTRSLTEAFPYLSAKSIWGALDRLTKAGVIMKGNYNANAYDRTLWYAFVLESFWIQPEGEFHYVKRENGSRQNAQPIPDTLPDIKTDKDSAPDGDGGKMNGGKVKTETGGKKKAAPAAPRPFWQPLVDTWFDFYKSKFSGEEPNFLGRNPAMFGKLVDLLQNRARVKKAGWNETYAINALNYFLKLAHAEDWLSKHFLLENLVSQFDAVYARAANARKPATTSVTRPVGLEAEIDYLRARIQEPDFDDRAITPDLYERMVARGHLKVGAMKNFPADSPEQSQRLAVLEFFKPKTTTA